MGSGPFAVGDTPTLGDCSVAPYMMLMKKLEEARNDDHAANKYGKKVDDNGGFNPCG